MHRCPACGSHKHQVRDSRPYEATVRRRRACLDCGERWATFEVSEAAYAALTDLNGLLKRVARSITAAASAVEDARGEGLLIQHDFDLSGDVVKRRKRGPKAHAPAANPLP